MTEIIDKGLYDGDLAAYLDGWLDEKEIKEGIHASCIDVSTTSPRPPSTWPRARRT